MAQKNFLSGIVLSFFKKLFSVPENKSKDLGSPKKFLIVRQHNQLGDLLAGVSLFRAIKETYPESHTTLIVSPFNYPGLIKNRFIDNLFIFNKKKLYNPFYFAKFIKLIRLKYDVAIVPVVVSISFTSNLICALSNSKIKIGAKSLDEITNESAFFFDRRVNLNWTLHPDSNVSERSLDIVRPFGINTKNFRSEISFDDADVKFAQEYIFSLKDKAEDLVIGLHVGAGKPANRWSLNKYVVLINNIREEYNAKFYLTGSSSDIEEINFVKDNLDFEIGTLKNHTIPEVAAVISLSNLFISNDTGIMHVAGSTETPQISIFGPTSPFNWAPIGSNKYFIRKSELIDDISVRNVFDICELILSKYNE